ncbi:MAG: DCC1-like thiol-disulfide oxidoreductase family protein [Phycisphaerales bacterium]
MSDDRPSSPPVAGPILFYDGSCGLCHAAVRWVLRHDRVGAIRFAPLQGATYAQLDVADKPTDLSTMVFLDDGALLTRGAAVVRFLKHMGGAWRPLGALMGLVPTALLDAGYRFVANRRVRWFGTADTCALPSASERSRFLE